MTCLVRLLCVQETPARKKQKLGLESRCLDTWRERETEGGGEAFAQRRKIDANRLIKVERTSKILVID